MNKTKHIAWVVFLLFYFMLACGNKKKDTLITNKSYDGAKLYKQNCVLCHGEDGGLGINNSKDLKVSKLNRAERIEIISNGRNAMIGFSETLEPEEIAAIADYTFTLK